MPDSSPTPYDSPEQNRLFPYAHPAAAAHCPTAPAGSRKFRRKFLLLSLALALSPIPLPFSVIHADWDQPSAYQAASAAEARLFGYAARIASLRDAALSTGAIDYRSVLEAAYGGAFDIDSVLAYKRQWREERLPANHTLTDYSTVAESAKVMATRPIRNRQLGSTMVGRYESRDHAIKIASVADDFAIVHEAGHALQRRALTDRSIHRSESIRFTELERQLHTVAAEAGLSEVATRRLRYLAAQDEFEVRLQDLNRFYALVIAPHPILTPYDALEALAGLGLAVEVDDVHAAFEGTDWELTREETRTLLASDRFASRIASYDAYFDDAYEFSMLQNLASRVDAKLWPRLLRKIVFEAPGHL